MFDTLDVGIGLRAHHYSTFAWLLCVDLSLINEGEGCALAQVMAFDANMLQRVFSVVTYPAPCTRQLLDGERPAPGTAVPLALGPRWLAYASNQVSHLSLTPLTPASVVSPEMTRMVPTMVTQLLRRHCHYGFVWNAGDHGP